MIREVSAGGVVIRNSNAVWRMAAIELPAVPIAGLRSIAGRPRKEKTVLCLPKGLVDPGEKPLQAALREVREETGLVAVPIAKIADIKYVYTRRWSDGERVFKIVTFYLLRYESGRINEIAPEMRLEVARARWVRLDEAQKLLSYKGEKDVARRALEFVATHSEV